MPVGPTIYKTPKTSLPPNKPDERTKRLWAKFQKTKSGSGTLPKRRAI